LSQDLSPFAPVQLNIEPRADGTTVLSNGLALISPCTTLIQRLRDWAQRTPDAVCLAERDGSGWRRVNYAAAWADIQRLARHLLPLQLSDERPLLILAPNSIDHALIALAGMVIGAPAATVSVAYAASSGQLSKLRAAVERLTPGAVYLEGGPAMMAALRSVAPDLPVISPRALEGATVVADLPPADMATVAAAADAVGPDNIAKFLFTSGSTGAPKAVPNTHRMMCSSIDAVGQLWPFLHRRPPVLVDWLPWSHTFGGNFCFTIALNFGGAFYIDGGKPLPGNIGTTVANLRDVQPTLYLSVPGGYEALLPAFEADEDFAARFFGGLDILFNAGSAMPSSIRARLESLVARVRPKPLPMVSSWGSTETAPCCTAVYFPSTHAQNIGLPLPGVELKLVPTRGRMELRVRGDNVMKGYWRQASDAVFDDEGFYLMGDAGRFVDPSRPDMGLLFDGRVAENFKLNSGTWVHVGPLRLAAIAAAQPLLADVAITGHARNEIGLLAFPNLEACRAHLGDATGSLTADEIASHPQLIAALTDAFRRHNRSQSGSSSRFSRFLIQSEPPSMEFSEITEKGYLNQRAVLERRAATVETLHATGHSLADVSSAALV
jgi:feruloyl-CoA synthase